MRARKDQIRSTRDWFIYTLYEMDEPVESIAVVFGLSKSSVWRIHARIEASEALREDDMYRRRKEADLAAMVEVDRKANADRLYWQTKEESTEFEGALH